MLFWKKPKNIFIQNHVCMHVCICICMYIKWLFSFASHLHFTNQKRTIFTNSVWLPSEWPARTDPIFWKLIWLNAAYEKFSNLERCYGRQERTCVYMHNLGHWVCACFRTSRWADDEGAPLQLNNWTESS